MTVKTSAGTWARYAQCENGVLLPAEAMRRYNTHNGEAMENQRSAHRFIAIIALALCTAVILNSCSTAGNQGRYELHTAFESDWVTVFIVDTLTGTTKVVAYGSPESGGHQFGVSFEQMKPVPAPLGTENE